MKHRSILVLLIFIAMSLAIVLPATAAQNTLTVKLGQVARIVDGGQALELRVSSRCPAGQQVLEAFVYVVQNGNQSNFGGLPVTCDGKAHHGGVRVTVMSGSPVFERGTATASAFVLVLDPATGETTTGQDNQDIKLH